MTEKSQQNVEDTLRLELAEGDAMIGTLAPILRHLLANDARSMFSDEIIARIRGMLGHVADQLLTAQGMAGELDDMQAHIDAHREGLIAALMGDAAVLNHVHALAQEAQLAERLKAHCGIDPVLTPLLQALIASAEPEKAAAAMHMLAAQARFVQSQRRMELPLTELPGDLFHSALLALRKQTAEFDKDAAEKAERGLREEYDEGHGRLGLIARLVTGMGRGAIAALSLEHAGVAIFLSTLAIASGQERDVVVQSTNDGQSVRLALSLLATGLKSKAVEGQLLLLHPDMILPQGLDQLGTDRAAALLSASAPQNAG